VKMSEKGSEKGSVQQLQFLQCFALATLFAVLQTGWIASTRQA